MTLTAGQDDANQERRTTDCPVTIRFSHIDAAGIVFYARYYELLSRSFPQAPVDRPPFALESEFRRPNRFGDRLTLCYSRESRADAWTLSARMDGREHFSIRSVPDAAPRRAGDLAGRTASSFEAEPLTVDAWCSGPDGRLQLSRFFELVNETVEQWFGATLGGGVEELYWHRRIGIPTVRFMTRCLALPRLGDSIRLGIRPERIGNRSVTLTTSLRRGGECLIENEQVIVFVQMHDDGYDTIPIPDDIRRRLDEQAGAGGSTARGHVAS